MSTSPWSQAPAPLKPSCNQRVTSREIGEIHGYHWSWPGEGWSMPFQWQWLMKLDQNESVHWKTIWLRGLQFEILVSLGKSWPKPNRWVKRVPLFGRDEIPVRFRRFARDRRVYLLELLQQDTAEPNWPAPFYLTPRSHVQVPGCTDRKVLCSWGWEYSCSQSRSTEFTNRLASCSKVLWNLQLLLHRMKPTDQQIFCIAKLVIFEYGQKISHRGKVWLKFAATKNRCGRCERTVMSKLLLALLPAAFGQQQAGQASCGSVVRI